MKRKDLLTKLLLLCVMIVGSVNAAWADTVLKTIDFSDSSWSGVTFSQGASDDPETINDVTFNAKSDTYHFSVADGALTFPGTNMGSGNYALGFPVTGIIGGVVYVKVYNGSSYQSFKYTIKNGGTAFSTSDCGSGTSLYSGFVTKFDLTDSKAYIYIGRVGASYQTISKIEVLTPELEDLSSSSFYQLYKQSSTTVSLSTLITDANLPSYIMMDISATNYATGNSSEVRSPHDFSQIDNSKRYYRLKGSSSGRIIIGGLSHVKTVHLYGNGNTTQTRNIKSTVIKLSGDGTAMTVPDVEFENSYQTVKDYSIDFASCDGYDANTYYLYIITFTNAFELWGLYIEPTASCTSVDAPTGLSCSAHTKNSLTFGWTAAANASSYDVTLYSDSGCTAQVTSANVTSTSKEFTGLSGGTTYYCKVQSKGDGSTYCTEGNVTSAASGTTATKDYTVTVESNNDSYGTASAEDSSLDEDEKTTITATAETGYKFRSWAVSGTGAELSSETANPVTFTMGSADATVTANFSALETYTITYAKGAYGSGSTISNGNKTEDVDFTLSSETYTYSGHKQLGWSTSDAGEKAYDLGETYTANADLDLYPYWVETHTITYNGNGGSGYMLSTTDVGEISLRANIYTNTGYTFLGWATSQSNADAGVVAYTDKATYILDADATLYAVWAESYCEMKPATSGDAPSVGGVVSMQSGAFGGAVKIKTSSASSMSYVTNGFQAAYGATTLDVTLNVLLKPGSIIVVTLYTGNASYSPGYDLYTSDGTKKIDSFVMTEAASTTFQYKVVADDDLDGTNGFKLVKTNNYTIVLKSLNVTDCQHGGIISASGWSTYSSNKKLDLSTLTADNSITAYYAKAIADGYVSMTPTDAIIDADEGIMIKGTAGDKFTIDATTSATTFSGDNLLEGLPNGGTVSANDGNYVFGWADAADPGFYFVNDTEPTLGAGKAYLSTGSSSQAARLTMIFDDDEVTTGIADAVQSSKFKDQSYYDLQGRKVAQPTKGLYIVNGKKVVVK